MKSKFALAALLTGVAGTLGATTGPYSGLEQREIATLSPADIDDLVNGRGWGFALAAELNGYPGPTHVLELADDLSLDDAQREAIEEIRVRMSSAAQALGPELIAAEAALDEAFETGTIDAATLAELTARSAAVEAELRAIHLAAHLEVTPLLSRHQIMTYNRLRGYAGSDAGHGGHGDH